MSCRKVQDGALRLVVLPRYGRFAASVRHPLLEGNLLAELCWRVRGRNYMGLCGKCRVYIMGET